MSFVTDEKLLARLLAIGAAFTTIFIVSGSVTDPVNVPKMLSLGVISCAAIATVLSSHLRGRLRDSRWLAISTLLFIFFMIASVTMSDSPLSQNLYGAYGRNNGLLTYLFLSFILISAATLRSNFEFLTRALLIAGLINVAYCLWVVSFGDFIGWSNPYGNILGTLGNPNFIGSFLGIFFAAFLAMSIDRNSHRIFRFSALLILPITAFEIIKSHAIQGRVVAALGVGIIGFLYIRGKFGRLVLSVYSVLVLATGTISLLGALQIGPLTQFIYKTSVSLRGQYWLAGWNTGKSHPISGVGMDSFGDWYRRSRDAHALELPGPNTVVNAAHNVPLDIFAFGGLPLFLTYLLIIGFALVAAIRVVGRSKDFNPTFAILLTAWAGYQVQSVISINQIGLAIWGWLLSGALIGFEIASRNPGQIPNELPRVKTSVRKSEVIQPRIVLAGSIGALAGLILALPPLTADAKWRSGQVARTVPAIEATMIASYFNPQNVTKYLMNIQAFEDSKLFDLSHKYAIEALKWNPENFDLWRAIYFLKNSTSAEKRTALIKMKRLDPLNQDVTFTQ